jgi:rod shape-determining protein MreD
MSSKKLLIISLALAFVIQKTLGGHVMLLTLLGWFVVRPTRECVWAAFFSGLILDLFSNAPFGVNSALFLILALGGFLLFRKGALTIKTLYLLPYVFLTIGFYNTFLDLLWWGEVNSSFNLRGAISSTFWAIIIVKTLLWAKERIVVERDLQLEFGL